jgi:esterase/lipase superfamily enzyme
MVREYLKHYSRRLGREMEVLAFGHGGLPVMVFPTSGGRFYEFEDRGMIAALADKIDAGQMRLYCVDSVDLESWYNQHVSPRQRIARHLQYEEYLLHEMVPLIRQRAGETGSDFPGLAALGCSLGGFHAANIAFRHPEIFTGMVSLSGAFDLSSFLDGYQDLDCYYNLPTYYLPNLSDPWFLERFRRNRFVLATGWDDHCLGQNRKLSRILHEIDLPHQLHVWDAPNSHDWPTWQRMVVEYL